MTGTPMVAASPERHDGGLQANPVEVQSYQPPWKVLSDFALQSDIDQPAFQQLVSVRSQPVQASLRSGQSNRGFSKRAGCPQRDEQSRLAGFSRNCKVGVMAQCKCGKLNWFNRAWCKIYVSAQRSSCRVGWELDKAWPRSETNLAHTLLKTESISIQRTKTFFLVACTFVKTVSKIRPSPLWANFAFMRQGGF